MSFGKNKFGNLEMVVEVKVETLLQKLAENLEKHKEKVTKATAARNEAIVKAVAKVNRQVRKAQKEGVVIESKSIALNFPEVQSHVDDYEDAIGLLKLHIGGSMKIDSSTYDKFIQDKWEWKEHFDFSNATYLGG